MIFTRNLLVNIDLLLVLIKKCSVSDKTQRNKCSFVVMMTTVVKYVILPKVNSGRINNLIKNKLTKTIIFFVGYEHMKNNDKIKMT